ncbi:uncharacterized protein LDX57_004358 [Aspergillus melleus]|uniref:uncharacterized protein n=1 Tax=Aspergillus melleus TaxID=138277 RepID=UPI001E8EEEAD|nr:uncharacterized protein LDX57_004358 [Aspergillus melleus]KAH8426623.1 hypothetical protein LDX57_004358 [Aspergillus melleus]
MRLVHFVVLFFAALVASRAVDHAGDMNGLPHTTQDIAPSTTDATEVANDSKKPLNVDDVLNHPSSNDTTPVEVEHDEHDNETEENDSVLVVRKVGRKKNCIAARDCPFNSYCCKEGRHCCAKPSKHKISWFDMWDG